MKQNGLLVPPYDILSKVIGASRIYYTLTEQQTVTQPRMEAANVTTEATTKSERSAYRKLEIVCTASHVLVPMQ